MNKNILQKTIEELAEFLAGQDIDDSKSLAYIADDVSKDINENLAYDAADVQDLIVEPCTSYSDYDDFKDELKSYIERKAANETLFDLVEMHLKEKGMKPADVYRNAQISKQDFSRYVRPDADISRIMVFNLAIGLRLDEEETKRLLRSAGYGFNKRSKFDLIVMYCINRELYDVTFINLLLDEFGQPLLKTHYYEQN